MLEIILSVLVIDTGVTPTDKTRPYLNSYDYETIHDHGTSIVSIILSDDTKDWVCKNVKVDVCNVGADSKGYMSCLLWAVEKKYDYINISLSGKDNIVGEETLLNKITKTSTVIVAAGNDRQEILYAYPAKYLYNKWDNFFVITNYKHPSSNRGFGTIDIEGNNVPTIIKNGVKILSGTSVSAARYTHKLLKDKCNEINSR